MFYHMTFQSVIADEHCVPVWSSYCRTDRRYLTCHLPSPFEIPAFTAGTKLKSACLILYMSVMLFITLLIHLSFPISNFSCFHIIILAKTRIIKQKQMSNMGCNQTSLELCLLSTELPINKHFHALCSSA